MVLIFLLSIRITKTVKKPGKKINLVVAETGEVALLSSVQTFPDKMLENWLTSSFCTCFVKNNSKHSNVHILVIRLLLYCFDVSLVLVRSWSAFCFIF